MLPKPLQNVLYLLGLLTLALRQLTKSQASFIHPYFIAAELLGRYLAIDDGLSEKLLAQFLRCYPWFSFEGDVLYFVYFLLHFGYLM